MSVGMVEVGTTVGVVAGCWVGSSLPRLLNMVHNSIILNSSCYVLSVVGRMDKSPPSDQVQE